MLIFSVNLSSNMLINVMPFLLQLQASNLLENMVWRSPGSCLNEDILFNLNTVYELETSRALQKKHKILDLVCQHRGDGFNTQCLKLT